MYDEHISHLKETDDGAPDRHATWFYYTRTEKGRSYKIHCRRPAPADVERRSFDGGAEEVLLDENMIAEGKSQCVVLGVRPSPNHATLAYSADFTGNETYTVNFRHLASGQLQGSLEGVCGAAVWGSDTVVYYITEDAAKRPWKLWRHIMGTSQDVDTCLFTEEDELFGLGISKTTSGRFLVAQSESTETVEIHLIDLEAGEASPLKVLQPRRFGLRYEVEHAGESLLIWTNKDGAINNRLMRVSVESALAGTGVAEAWAEVLPYNPAIRIENLVALANGVAFEGREGGLTRIWVLDRSLNPASLQRVEFDEELYEVQLGAQRDHDSPFLRIIYSSLTTPRTAYDCDLRVGNNQRLHLVWRLDVPNFDPSRYTCKRMFAKAPDGTQIPMNLVCLKTLFDEETQTPKPCMLYGYGSYGICMDPHFDVHILPYLDRGMVYCIANVRGGGEMGRYWYEEHGKYLTKRNTFMDFIACAEHLVEKQITSPDKLAIEGRSAGGLLVGSVLNMRPDLFKVAVAGVPFVDVMNTMSDPSIPLTTGEWEEWGNPNDWRYFDYMLSYSPYDNVRSVPYPNIVITAGLHDPRVAFWEPAKWASKLRQHNTNANSDIILKMDLEVGHFSASDRYRYKREKSFDQAFVLDKLGLGDKK